MFETYQVQIAPQLVVVENTSNNNSLLTEAMGVQSDTIFRNCTKFLSEKYIWYRPFYQHWVMNAHTLQHTSHKNKVPNLCIFLESQLLSYITKEILSSSTFSFVVTELMKNISNYFGTFWRGPLSSRIFSVLVIRKFLEVNNYDSLGSKSILI